MTRKRVQEDTENMRRHQKKVITEADFKKMQEDYEYQVFLLKGIINRNKHLLYLQGKEKNSAKTIKLYNLFALFVLSIVLSVFISWLLLK